MNFHKLEELRKAQGVSAAHLCSLIGKNRTYIADCSRYSIRVPLEYVEVWADALHTTADYLNDITDVAEIPSSVMEEEEVKVALFGGSDKVTDEDWQEVLRFVEYIKERKK